MKGGKNMRNIKKPSKYYRKTWNEQKQQEQQQKIQLSYTQIVKKNTDKSQVNESFLVSQLRENYLL